jgi:hypothetical protein
VRIDADRNGEPHLWRSLRSNRIVDTVCIDANSSPASAIWENIFLQNHEVSEPDAANKWFAYAENQGIDIPKAISIWEDAATESGAESRRIIGAAGITIETDRLYGHGPRRT